MTRSAQGKPLQRLASSISACSAQSAVYGKCVVVQYENIHKNACEKEFLAFKECVTKAAGRKW
ncbi:hypothetical protein YB2330_003551 [Saitoella coloradoensis]